MSQVCLHQRLEYSMKDPTNTPPGVLSAHSSKGWSCKEVNDHGIVVLHVVSTRFLDGRNSKTETPTTLALRHLIESTRQN